MATNSNQLIVEHFLRFLLDNQFITNNQCSRADLQMIYSQYQIGGIPFFRMLQLLNLFGYIKKRSGDGSIIKFRGNCLEAFASRGSAGTSFMLPQPMARPKKTVLVSQRFALRSPKREQRLPQGQFCSVCVCPLDRDHALTLVHQLRINYITNRAFFQRKKDITIEHKEGFGTNEEDVICRPNIRRVLDLNIFNRSKDSYEVVTTVVLQNDIPEITISNNFPFVLRPNTFKKIFIYATLPELGVVWYPLVFKVETVSTRETYYILKQLVFRVQTELLDELMPVQPYTPASRPVLVLDEKTIIRGESAPVRASGLKQYKYLPNYGIPRDLRTILNRGLQEFVGIKQEEYQKLQYIRSLVNQDDLARSLQKSNYCELLHYFIYFEEHHLQKEIHNYDRADQTFLPGRNEHLLLLKIPDLAARRPSLVRTDSVYVTSKDLNAQYQGVVHYVNRDSVELGFNRSFTASVLRNIRAKFFVSFGLGRRVIRLEHQAVDLVKQDKVVDYFFPENVPPQPPCININTWFNQRLAYNPLQKQAVIQILSKSTFTEPYLIFGPPGTGKTTTVVETILQLLQRKTRSHILVCAPSNSAADEITLRLIRDGQVPKTDLFRMGAYCYSSEAVHPLVRHYCNFDDNGETFFPDIATVCKYRVVVTTFTTAARLVGANVKPGHFDYVFIDESGQATESETLIPIAGILTDSNKPGKLLGHVILVGDPNQLGPIINSDVAIQLGYETSMLERLMNTCRIYGKNQDGNYNPQVLTKLVINFRSHPAILEVPNRSFYDGELVACGKEELINRGLGLDFLPNGRVPVMFHHIEGVDQREQNSPSFFNLQEIDPILKYLYTLIVTYRFRASDIGIVSPYKKQAQKIERICKSKGWGDIMIGSVEKFQGQERLVILISTVRSNYEFLDHDHRFHLGFLKNPKRFNVALTRAIALLIVVGNAKVLQHDKHWYSFIKYCKDNGAVRGQCFELAKDISWTHDPPIDISRLTTNSSSDEL